MNIFLFILSLSCLILFSANDKANADTTEIKLCLQLFPAEPGKEQEHNDLIAEKLYELDNIANQLQNKKNRELNYDTLYSIRNAELKVDNKATTEELRNLFIPHIENHRSDRTSIVDQYASIHLRFFDPDEVKKVQKDFDLKKSVSGIYGTEVLKSWKIADDYLTEIPDEKFRITPELILKVVGFSSHTLKPFGRFSELIPFSIPGITPNTSHKRFKLMFNSGRSPLTHPLTEDQYKVIKENKWIEGFYEIPFLSKPNARRGLIIYTAPWKVKQKLQALVEWYEKNENTMDPIKLAATFQRILISIHPLVDGNGRTSRLLMDRILLQKGLPPPIITSRNLDLYASIEDFEQHIREGVALMMTAFKNGLHIPHYSPGKNIDVQVSDFLEFENSITKAEHHLAKKFKKLRLKKVSIKGKHFSLQSDGFLYDQYEVPYVFQKGTLFPIADRSLEFFDMGGRLKEFYSVSKYSYEDENGQTVTNKNEYKGFRKTLAPFKASIIRDNLKFLDLIDSNRLTIESVHVENFDSIKPANKTGKPHIYPWQVPYFLRFFTIKAKSLYEILSPSFESETTFGQRIRATDANNKLNPEISATDVLSQYQYMDINYRDLMDAAQNYPELHRVILNKRKELFIAAKELIKDALNEYENLSPSEKNLLKSDYKFNLFYTYFLNSNLRFNSLDEAFKTDGDNSTTLLRCSNANSCKYGYVPATYWRKMIGKFPGLSHIQKSVSEYTKMLNSEEDLKAHIEKIKSYKYLPQFLKSKYINQLTNNLENLKAMLKNGEGTLYIELGSQVEYSIAGDREYYTLRNRVQGNDQDEGGISFSVSPELYFDGISFASGKKEDSVVSIVKVPKNKFNLSFNSSFEHEYEAIVKYFVSSKGILKQFTAKDTEKKLDLEAYPHLKELMKKLVGLRPSRIEEVEGEGEIEPDPSSYEIDENGAVG